MIAFKIVVTSTIVVIALTLGRISWNFQSWWQYLTAVGCVAFSLYGLLLVRTIWHVSSR